MAQSRRGGKTGKKGGYAAVDEPTDANAADLALDWSASKVAERSRVIAKVDTDIQRIMAKDSGANDPVEVVLTELERECILDVYRDMCQKLQHEAFKKYYHFSKSEDEYLCHFRLRERVEPYFANLDTGQSVWKRKMLSILGLANLIIFGPEIFNELSEKCFSGCLAEYGPEVRDHETPQSKGMHKMKYYTGNSVDLDTVVLRCSDRIVREAINAQNKHQDLPLHMSSDDFGASVQARQIAITAASPLVESFCTDFKLEGAARTRRRLDLDVEDLTQQIPLARSNKDRGKWVLWQYINTGVNSFHANVPNMSDVYGAILLSPWHLAKAWCTIHSEFEPGPERDKYVAEFFEEAVGDSCFNMKWKNIEEFCGKLAKLGTIIERLQKLQMRKQAEFAAIYARKDVGQEEQDRLESALLFSLCQTECPMGRDQHGHNREITEGDCVAFVADPGAAI